MVLTRRTTFTLCLAPVLPEPEPAQTPTPIPQLPSVPQQIEEAADRWGVDASRMLRIAWCESKWGTHINTYNGRSGHLGIFQFSPSTWVWASSQAGVGGAPATDDSANIEAAMWLAKTQGFGHWSCK